MLKKITLYPLALLYGIITSFRNRHYDKGMYLQTSFKKPVIVVGNLTVGGTGKTPHIEYLAKQLIDHKKIALVSRGYGRNTKGFIRADNDSDANQIGDEPMQYFTKFSSKAIIAVGEKRVNAIKQLLKRDTFELFLLDDAYQHRNLKASYYILLTDFERLFTNDFMLPLGLLRESREGASRADVIIVSKCPDSLNEEAQESIIKQIRKYSDAPVYFTRMYQGRPQKYQSNEELKIGTEVISLSAIAQNDRFNDQVAVNYKVKKKFAYRDHHNFTIKELKEVLGYSLEHKLPVVTTEKDFMRLSQPEFMDLTTKMSIFVVPIEVQFLEKENEFLSRLEKAVN